MAEILAVKNGVVLPREMAVARPRMPVRWAAGRATGRGLRRG
jgi:hypothetical protein